MIPVFNIHIHFRLRTLLLTCLVLLSGTTIRSFPAYSFGVEENEDSVRLWNYFQKANESIDLDSAVYYQELSMKLARKMNGHSFLIQALINQGRFKSLRNLDDLGKTDYEKAIELARQHDNIQLIQAATIELSEYYYFVDSLEQSVSLAFQIIDEVIEVPDSAKAARCFNILGINFLKQKQFDLALKYFQQFEIYAKGYNKIVARANAALALTELTRYPEALEMFKKCVNQNPGDNILDIQDNANAYNSISDLFYKMNMYDSAEYYGLKAYAIFTKFNNSFNSYFAAQNLSKIYIDWNKPEVAIAYGDTAMKLAEETNSIRLVWQAHEFLGRAYAKADNHQKSYQFLNEAYNLKDSVSSLERNEVINELEVRYQAERRETENNMLKMEQKIQQMTISRQKAFLIMVSAVTIIVCLVLILLWKLLQKRNQDAKRIKHQNELLALQTSKLKQTDESRSRFFSNISHDLRTPLTLINGFFQVLKEDSNLLTEKTEQAQERAVQSLKQMAQLTDEINDLTLIDGNKIDLSYSLVPIAQLVSLHIKMFHTHAELKNIQLKFDCEIDPGINIHADGKQVEKIIHNLLSNALKFTDSGGEITTTVSAGEDRVLIKVSDNGIGIDDKHLPYVFDRFFQSGEQDHSSKEGLGIGLSMVKELTELHGGNVRAESECGKGSDFYVELPFNLDKQITLSEKNYRLSVPPVIKKKSKIRQIPVLDNEDKFYVLIVEDHEEILNYVISEISPQYHILSAENGEQAIDILSKRKVDLILTDLMMPVVDGFQLIQYVKNQEQLKNIPILVLSAKSTNPDKDRVLQLGVNDFVAKPFDHQELNQRIENLLKQNDKSDFYATVANEKGYLSDIERNLIGKLDDLIFKHIDDPNLSVQMIADLLNTSERNAGRIVKSLTNEPPKSYIRKLRIDYAENLLKTRKVKSIKALCKAVGLKNSNSFAIQFEKQKGYSPKELIDK